MINNEYELKEGGPDPCPKCGHKGCACVSEFFVIDTYEERTNKLRKQGWTRFHDDWCYRVAEGIAKLKHSVRERIYESNSESLNSFSAESLPKLLALPITALHADGPRNNKFVFVKDLVAGVMKVTGIPEDVVVSFIASNGTHILVNKDKGGEEVANQRAAVTVMVANAALEGIRELQKQKVLKVNETKGTVEVFKSPKWLWAQYEHGVKALLGEE